MHTLTKPYTCSYNVINARRMRMRVTVVIIIICVCVCVCLCVHVHYHSGASVRRVRQIELTRLVFAELKLADFAKKLSSLSYTLSFSHRQVGHLQFIEVATWQLRLSI